MDILCSLRIVPARSTCVAMDRQECHAVEKDIQGTEECQYPNTTHWPKEHNCSQHRPVYNENTASLFTCAARS
jgi:hypothetical protein